MMKMMVHKIIFSICCLILASACSSKKDVTGTKFVISNMISANAKLSGAIIYGVHQENGQKMSLKFSTEMDKQTIELSRGRWTFAAIGWPQNSGEELVGTPKCGAIENVVLNQPTQSLSITLSVNGCSNPIFGPNTDDFKDVSGGTYALKGIKIANCVTSPTDGFCNALGPFRSYKMIAQAPNGDLVSPCLAQTDNSVVYLNTSSSVPTQQLTFPFIQNMGNIPLRVQSFTGTTCSGVPEVADLPRGITPYINPFTTGLLRDKDNDVKLVPGTVIIPFSENIVCSGERLSALPFASGPHQVPPSKWDNLICNAAQLESLSTLASLNGSYTLISNFNVGTHTPIGTTTVPFVGDFQGQGHTLSNISITGSPNGYTGFFGKISTASARVENLQLDHLNLYVSSASSFYHGGLAGFIDGGSLYNINLSNINIDVTSASYTGGFIGYATGTAINFHQVNGQAISVSGADYVGGFAGYFSGLSNGISLIDLVGVTVSATPVSAGMIGGFAGSMSGSNTYDIGIRNLNLNVTNANTAGIGGAFGEISSNSHAEFIKLTGTNNITVNGATPAANSAIGGLAGKIQSSAALRNSRVAVNITASTTFIGGAVGLIDSSSLPHAQVIGTLVTGEINCTTGNSYCGGAVGKLYINTVADPLNAHVMDLSSAANVYGINNVGGAFGAISGGTVEGVIAKGGVATSSTGTSVGGFAGQIKSASSAITVRNSYSTVNAYGYTYVGGFVGLLDPTGNPLNLSMTFAYGTASAVVATYLSPYEGQMVSAPAGNYNYYRMDSSIPLSSITSASVATAAFTSSAPFSFNFADRWVMIAGDSYPNLRWNYVLSQFGNTLGSPNDPFLISTPAQFNLIGDNQRFMYSHFLQTADLNFGNGAPNFIGTASNPFGGSYLGNDVAIKNVSITATSGDTNVGIFRYVAGAHIGGVTSRDSDSEDEGKLHLDNVHVTGGSNNIGLLVGTASISSWGQPTLFTNIVVENNSDISAASATAVGSVAGQAVGAAFDNVKNAASITANGYAGGIVGTITGQGQPMKRVMNTGNIVVTADYAGGIAGYAYPAGSANYSELYNQANISAAQYSGGILGYVDGSGTFVTNALSIYSTITATMNLGGIIGRAGGSTTTNFFDYAFVYMNTVTATGSHGSVTGYHGGATSSAHLFGDTANVGANDPSSYTSTSTAALQNGSNYGFDTSLWDFAPGHYPTLHFISE